jgi:hypothetical protein
MSTARAVPGPIADHDADFYSWAMETAAAIRAGRLDGLDWLAIAEEIEDMGRSERRALASRLEVLQAHLLKWRHQAQLRSRSWSGTIKEQRRRAVRLLQENPGLKPQLADLCTDTYGTARALAERDTGLDEALFPSAPPWTVEQALDETYWPDAVPGAHRE